MRKVLVMWADPESPNFGVRALAEGMRAGLTGSDLTFASHRLPLNAGALSLKRLIFAAVNPWHPVRRELANYELIVDVGEGDSFASIYGAKRFGKMVASKVAAGKSARRFVLAPQTLGPWEGKLWTSIARLATRQAAQVWARDSDSEKRAMRAGLKRVSVATDLVFAVPEPEAHEAEEIDVLVNVSGLLWAPNPHVDNEKYRRTIRAILAQSTPRITIGLLVHVDAEGTQDDDVAISNQLGAEFGIPVIREVNLQDLRSRIRGARLLIGSRMHACLNAISVGTPAIPLAYSDKFEPLFVGLGYPYVRDLRVGTGEERLSLEEILAEPKMRDDATTARDAGRLRINRFFESLGSHGNRI